MSAPVPARDYQELLSNNRAWVEERLAEEPGYFRRLAAGQEPGFLLVGCSDSRKALNVLTGTNPESSSSTATSPTRWPPTT